MWPQQWEITITKNKTDKLLKLQLKCRFRNIKLITTTTTKSTNTLKQH